jgi:hypothetical protein
MAAFALCGATPLHAQTDAARESFGTALATNDTRPDYGPLWTDDGGQVVTQPAGPAPHAATHGNQGPHDQLRHTLADHK